MRLEFLLEGSAECPLIRVFDFTPTEAQRLASTIADLAAGRAERVAVHTLSGVRAIGGCKLTLISRGWDQAVVRIGPFAFECGFTPGTWENVAGLIEPFVAGSGGYQWLAGAPGEASVLFSPSGQW